MDKPVGEPANVQPEVRRALLCHPPEGTFDYNSPYLKWVKRRYGKILYDSAFILRTRLPDFRKGEDLRGLCSFYTQATKPGSKKLKENDALATNTPVRSGCFNCFPHLLEFQPCEFQGCHEKTIALCLSLRKALLYRQESTQSSKGACSTAATALRTTGAKRPKLSLQRRALASGELTLGAR